MLYIYILGVHLKGLVNMKNNILRGFECSSYFCSAKYSSSFRVYGNYWQQECQ